MATSNFLSVVDVKLAPNTHVNLCVLQNTIDFFVFVKATLTSFCSSVYHRLLPHSLRRESKDEQCSVGNTWHPQ